MELFKLPLNCKVNKNIPKELIYKNAEADEKLKRVFVDNVEKIRYEYAITKDNSNIDISVEDEEKYEEIHFISVVFKKKEKEKVVLKLLHQLIPKATVLIFGYGDKRMVSLAKKNIANNKVQIMDVYTTHWIDQDNVWLKRCDYRKFNSSNLKSVYYNLIDTVRMINLGKEVEHLDKVGGKTLELLEALNSDIERLKLERKKESQINRVAKIQQELLEKIEIRNKLLDR